MKADAQTSSFDSASLDLPQAEYMPSLILISAMLIGTWIRFYHMDFQSLWVDEMFVTLASSSPNLHDLFHKWMFVDAHPPLYHLVLYYWIKIFGNSVASVRTPAAIAGVMTMPAMYYFGKRVLNRDIALIATILIALSGSAIRYSQECKNYAFVLLFSTCSTLLWLDLLKYYLGFSKRTFSQPVYWVFTLLAFFTHYFASSLICMQGLVLAAVVMKTRNRQHIRELITLALLTGVPFFAYFSYHMYITRQILYQASFGADTPAQFRTAMVLQYLAGWFGFVYWKSLVLALVVAVPAVFLGVSKTFAAFKSRLADRQRLVEVLAMIYTAVVPMALSIAYSVKVPETLVYRYVIMSMTAFYILTAIWIYHSMDLGLEKFSVSLWKRRTAICAFTLLLGLIQLSYARAYLNTVNKEQLREGAQYIIDHTQDTSDVFVYQSRVDRPITTYFDYFKETLPHAGKTIHTLPFTVQADLTPSQALEKLQAPHLDHYFIYVAHTTSIVSTLEEALKGAGIPFTTVPFFGVTVMEVTNSK